MLKSWLIQNFKPIVDSGELQLAPVTVLAGRNSSGKSSLIQSILMIAQTLSSRVLDRALLPNGPIVQLGTFEDILSEQTNFRTLVISFELEMEKEEKRVSSRTWVRQLDEQFFVELRAGIKSVKITTQFRSASNNGTSTSAIEASKVNVESVSLMVTAFPYRRLPYSQEPLSSPEEDKILREFSVDIKRLLPAELDKFLKGVSPEYLRLVPYTTEEANYLGTFSLKSKLANTRVPDPSLISFSHFLPTRLIGKYVIEERRKSLLMEEVKAAFEYPGTLFETAMKEFELLNSEILISDSLKGAILDLCNDEGIPATFSGQKLIDLINWHRSLKLNQRRRAFGSRLKEIVIQNILEGSLQAEIRDSKGTEALETVINNNYVVDLEECVERTVQFFTSKIRYLGPLRADPQAAQRFAPSSELDDVGTKGEYAAAVYDANHNARIRYYNPLSAQVERNTLKVALDTWTRYLGVANEIKIQEAGQSGVSWQVVHIKGHKALPLTAVGVGVSQILPILVMGLLAPDNTLLLVEQPELHLHPSVQARLGDFFMGLAKCGKQCLIETHSENLVSQLRYHIVQAGGQENSDCLVYFVDQDEQGAARFNPIEISPQGNILNWPDGFFDETMLQEDRITAASLKKRAKKTNNG
jgi:predicted ATPase